MPRKYVVQIPLSPPPLGVCIQSVYYLDLTIVAFIIGSIVGLAFWSEPGPSAPRQKKKLFFFFCRGALGLLSAGVLVWCFEPGVNSYPDTFESGLSGFQVLALPHFGEQSLPLTRSDPFTRVGSILMIVLSFTYLSFLQIFFLRRPANSFRCPPELPILILILFLSVRTFLIATDGILVVLAVEVIAFITIILMAIPLTTSKNNILILEACIKYFIFNAVSVACLLVGFSGYFFLFGTLNLVGIASTLSFTTKASSGLIGLFHVIFFVGFLLKMGIAPFHQWVPEVYEGCELLVTTLLILIIGPTLMLKFFGITKLLLPINNGAHFLLLFLFVFGLVGLVLGTLHAYAQVRIKKFLAYTGITHSAFILLSLSLGNWVGFFSGFVYFCVYTATNILLFSILIVDHQLASHTTVFFNQFKALARKNWFFSVVSIASFLSYAGIPPLGGFFSKILVLTLLIAYRPSFSLLFFILMILVLSAYVYLRVLKICFFEKQIFKTHVTMTLTQSKFPQYVYRYVYPGFLGPNPTLLVTASTFLTTSFVYCVTVALVGCLYAFTLLTKLLAYPIFSLFIGY